MDVRKRSWYCFFRLGYLVSFCLLLMMQGPFLAGAEEPVLQGRLEKTIDPDAVLQGRVLDTQTGQPISDAEVSLPDYGESTRTDRSGYYRLYKPSTKEPYIMSIEKPGYAPFSLSVTQTAPAMFNLRLTKQPLMLVLDNQLHHLGDGGYSAVSSNATQFRKPAEGPLLRLPFSLGPSQAISDSPYIQIGSIIGLDTAMTHFLSGNPLDTHASALEIRLNGRRIAQIQVNGDNQKIRFSPSLLNRVGSNVLEVQAGHQYPEPGRIDYDDMELIHLILFL